MTQRTQTAMQALLDLGQSVWLDYLRRGMLRSGELQGLIDDGLRGMTSNPTIFEHAIGGSSDYDDELLALAASPASDREVFERIAVEDVRQAADLFRPVYDASAGADGFVSLEVSASLARDTDGTIAEARRLWAAVDRPNLMIKVPGTKEGWPAVERLLTEGINVNITLLFSLEHYRQVAEAHLRALEARVRAGQPIARLASVASFFVSRVDTEADRRIEAKGGALLDLRGKVAVANAQLAYAWFRELLAGARWTRLAEAGARPQRLLWASTGTKNPAYSDVLYVDSLIGPDTINTMPPATLRLFEDHGTVRATLSDDASEARDVMQRLAAGGVDLDDVTRVLEDDGIEKFAKSYDGLIGVIASKRKALAAKAPPRHSAVFGSVDLAVARRLDAIDAAHLPRRIWERDPTVWKDDPDTPEIRDRLGWLTVGKAMAQQAKDLAAFADEVRAEFSRVVLCGMGGSSLAPEVLWRTFGAAPGLSGAPRARQHRSARRAPGRAGRRPGEDAVHHLEQVGHDPGERQLLPLLLGAHRRARLAVRGDHRSGHAARAARRRARLPPHVPQSARHRRPLLGALLLRAGAGGADRRGRRRAAAPGAPDGGGVRRRGARAGAIPARGWAPSWARPRWRDGTRPRSCCRRASRASGSGWSS